MQLDYVLEPGQTLGLSWFECLLCKCCLAIFHVVYLLDGVFFNVHY